jgi:hypothetical protein
VAVAVAVRQVATVARQSVAQAVAHQQTVQQQAQTQRAAAVAQDTAQHFETAAQAVAELFTSGLRFSHGTFCKN